jgi:membrane-associated phospholipid phosphatase
MFIFHSMTHVTLFIAITVYFLLLFSLRVNPLITAGQLVQEIFGSRKYFFHIAAMLAILFFNKIELSIEAMMKHQADFTPSIQALEGNFSVYFQRLFEHPWLTYILTYFYVIIFPALMIGSLLIYTSIRNYKLCYSTIYALMINYMVAIPFYLFFPVTEVWAYNSEVRFLILDVFPTFEQEYRPLSGLDNCFPSLHTSISVSLALIAVRSGNLFWGRFVVISAITIIFSTFYLGIHWITDMAGGVALGSFAAHVALRISEGKPVLGGVRMTRRLEERNASESGR